LVKLVVLEVAVRVNNTGCPSGTRSWKGWESNRNVEKRLCISCVFTMTFSKNTTTRYSLRSRPRTRHVNKNSTSL